MARVNKHQHVCTSRVPLAEYALREEGPAPALRSTAAASLHPAKTLPSFPINCACTESSSSSRGRCKGICSWDGEATGRGSSGRCRGTSSRSKACQWSSWRQVQVDLQALCRHKPLDAQVSHPK
jgi:hypothetical protein